MKHPNRQPCTDCQEIVQWSEELKGWTHPTPSECFMASIMPTFTPGNTNEKNYFDIVLHYGCETENCLGSVEVFENGTYGTCSSCLNMQMCDDISAPITPWEIEKYGGKLTTGICDYCETETEIDSFGWCKSCSE